MFEAALLGSIGGVWIALFAIFLFVTITWSYEYDNFFIASLLTLGGLTGLQFIFGIPVLSFLFYNPWFLLTGLLAYLLIGSLYAIYWKMPDFVNRNSEKIKAQYKHWKRHETGGKKYSYDSDESYAEFLQSSHYRFSMKNNKSTIFGWVFFWPFGVIWELMHKPVKWIWNSVYLLISDLLQDINIKTATTVLKQKSK